MTNNGYSNVIPIARLNLAHSWLQRSTIAGERPMKAIAAQISEGDLDYRSRMFTSAILFGFVGMLVMSGQWMFTILASIR